ncbi:hypothetical protein B0H19DRAFT_1056980 [Mycena capillaripes]|nr:hypothetical protein B0H19DRAFT_1056980 [Mycena capillaripes]
MTRSRRDSALFLSLQLPRMKLSLLYIALASACSGQLGSASPPVHVSSNIKTSDFDTVKVAASRSQALFCLDMRQRKAGDTDFRGILPGGCVCTDSHWTTRHTDSRWTTRHTDSVLARGYRVYLALVHRAVASLGLLGTCAVAFMFGFTITALVFELLSMACRALGHLILSEHFVTSAPPKNTTRPIAMEKVEPVGVVEAK